MSLQIHPTLGVCAEKPGQTQRNIRRNRLFPSDDFSDAPPGHPNGCCQTVLGDVHGFKKIFPQNFSGMHGGEVPFHSFTPSMVIDNFNLLKGLSIVK
jgi:hypothetical protein